MNTMDELIEESHAMAVAKGWWPAEGRSVVEQVNNFCAEISEAWEEYRHGRIQTWYQHKHGVEPIHKHTGMPENGEKPEGFLVELADLCIRLADTMGAYGWQYIDGTQWIPAEHPALIAKLHVCVTMMAPDCYSGWNSAAPHIASTMIRCCIGAANQNCIDLWPIIRAKMAFNATRPIRHGGLKA